MPDWYYRSSLAQWLSSIQPINPTPLRADHESVEHGYIDPFADLNAAASGMAKNWKLGAKYGSAYQRGPSGGSGMSTG